VAVSSDRGRYPVVPHVAETAVGPVAREVFPSLAVIDRETKLCLFGPHAERSLSRPGAEQRYHVIRSMKRLIRDYAEGIHVGHDMVPEGFDPAVMLRDFAGALRESILRSGLFHEDEPLETVLTWPANANGAQRYLTRRSFKEAGFEVIATLSEPAAAAIEFADRMALGNRTRARTLSMSIAVFDLGGGTFDVSLVKIDGDAFRIIDAAGIERLGGDDFDEILARLFARKLQVKFDALDPFKKSLLLNLSRMQKENISSGRVNSLTLAPRDLGFKGRAPRVGVAAYFRQVAELLKPAVEKLHALVNGRGAGKAGISARNLSAVYLVGGSSKLPLVWKMVSERFPNVRIVMSDKPFTSTAMGAAIHSAEGMRMQDILARNFGVLRLAEHGRRECFSPIFPAGTRLPARGDPAIECTIDYPPEHNIGHLKYLECASVDEQGLPSEGVRHWSDTLFPYDPSIPTRRRLDPDQIRERHDLQDKWVRETYACDADGVITVRIRRHCDGHTQAYEVFKK
jgi:molecular chaperone DnaK (HSP70)